MKKTTREINILKNEANKYAFSIVDNNIILYTSAFIYDEVIPLYNQIDEFLETDLIKLRIGNLYGVFDGWVIMEILPINFLNIEVKVLHRFYFYICKNQDETYSFYNEDGTLINKETFYDVAYLGFFSDSQKYLYLVCQKIVQGQDYTINSGVIDLTGNTIVNITSEYVFEPLRLADYIVLKKVNIINYEEIIRYDIYTSNGIMLYENLIDYDWLRI